MRAQLETRLDLRTTVDASVLATPEARLWLDSTTAADREAMLARVAAASDLALEDAAAAADDVVRRISGAPVELRYAAAQLRGIARRTPEVAGRTRKVHLASSFATALLCGNIDAPIDTGDAAGTNLVDIDANCWSDVLVDALGWQALSKLLPSIVADAATFRAPAVAWVYAALRREPEGASAIVVAAGTGDNPASLHGCAAVSSGDGGSGVTVVSLGTSDTAMVSLATSSSSAPNRRESKESGPLAWFLVSPVIMGTPRGGRFLLACLTRSGGAIARDACARCVCGVEASDSIDWAVVEREVDSALQALGDSSDSAARDAFRAFVEELVHDPGKLRALVGGDAQAVKNALLASSSSSPLKGRVAFAFVALASMQATALSLSTAPRDRGTSAAVLVTGGGARSAALCAIVAAAFRAPRVERLPEGCSTAAVGAAAVAAACCGNSGNRPAASRLRGLPRTALLLRSGSELADSGAAFAVGAVATSCFDA